MNFVKNETIYIKGMVCPRCIRVVYNICKELHIAIVSLRLGELILSGKIDPNEKKLLFNKLKDEGFELLDSKRNILINTIKTALIELVQSDYQILGNNKISDYISIVCNHDYSYLSNLFTSTEGQTIEKYLINLRVERVKELLIYNELSLNEIADKMNYSSAAYLSSQFKKIIGISPSNFRHLMNNSRKTLDEI